MDLESRTGAGRNRSPVVSDPVKWSCLEEELEGARVLSLCSVVSALASSLPGPLSLLSSTVFVYERPASSGHVKRGLECQTKRSRQQALLSVYVHDNSDGLVLRCYVVTLLRCYVVTLLRCYVAPYRSASTCYLLLVALAKFLLYVF